MRFLNNLSIAASTILMSLTIASSSIFAQVSKGPQPRIEVSSDYFYFGYMPINAIVQHVYWVRNTGNDTLRIVTVKPGCGCTTAPISKDAIAPGDSANLKVIFDSKNMTGKMVKDIDIFSNDPNKQSIAVKFFAVVNREHDFVRAEPNVLRFSKFGSKDGKMIKTFEVLNNFSTDIEVSLIELPAANFKIDKKNVKVRPGEKAQFTIEQLQSVTDEADVLTSVTFEFVGDETDRITIPLVAHLQQ
ncbi:MAG: DUF1573 domain-containing protein [bacterium]|nr:DUF1573 domain-containing protein [bacterium]